MSGRPNILQDQPHVLNDTDPLGHIPRQHDEDFRSGSVSDNFYSLVTTSDQTGNQILAVEFPQLR